MAFLIPEVEDQSSKSQSKVISTLYVPFYLRVSWICMSTF